MRPSYRQGGAAAQAGLSVRGVQGVVEMTHAIRAQFVGGIRGLQKTFARPPSIGLAPPKRPSSKPMIGAIDTSTRYRGQVGRGPARNAWGARHAGAPAHGAWPRCLLGQLRAFCTAPGALLAVMLARADHTVVCPVPHGGWRAATG